MVGTVIHNIYNCGLAMVDREKLESSSNLKFSLDGLNTIIYDPVLLWESIRGDEKDKEVKSSNNEKSKSKSISVKKSETDPEQNKN